MSHEFPIPRVINEVLLGDIVKCFVASSNPKTPDKVYEPCVNLADGTIDCDCEDYECGRRPAYRDKHGSETHPTIGDLAYQCKHLMAAIGHCIKQGHIAFNQPHRRTMDVDTSAQQEQERLRIISELQQPLTSDRVSQRQGGRGMTLDYLEANEVIDALNRIFNFDWSDDLVTHEKVSDKVYKAIVRIEVNMAGRYVSKTGVGVGRVQGQQVNDDEVEKAIKEAESDALKRAARKLGNQFGNSLYRKDHSQRYESVPAQRSSGNVTTHAPQQASPQQAMPPRAHPAVDPAFAQPVQPPARTPSQAAAQANGNYGPPDPDRLRTYTVPPETEFRKCKDCSSTIFWVEGLTRTGKALPLNGDGTVHYDTCGAKTQSPALTRHNNTSIGCNPEDPQAMQSNASGPISQKMVDDILVRAIQLYGEDDYIELMENWMQDKYRVQGVDQLSAVQGSEVFNALGYSLAKAEEEAAARGVAERAGRD